MIINKMTDNENGEQERALPLVSATTAETTTPSTPPPTPTGRIMTLLRQNSEKIGMFAEDVVLPRSQRAFPRSNGPATVPEEVVIDLESQNPSQGPYNTPTTVVVKKRPPANARSGNQFPIFMCAISFIQVVLFYSIDKDWLLLILGYDPHRRHEFWRLFTIMFAHSSMSHLWGNVIFQMILGVLLEVVHGWKRIGIIYMASVLGGSLLITVLGPNTYGVGASAGVYGLLFSHLSTIIINWNEMDRKCCRLFWLILYMSFDIGLNVYIEIILEHNTNTSHAGHIGGAVTGFLVSILVLKNFEKHHWEERMQKICKTLLLSMLGACLLVNIALSFTAFYTPEVWNLDYMGSYETYIVRMIVESPEDSPLRKECEKDEHCKLILDQYNHNGTLADIDISYPTNLSGEGGF